MKLVIKLVSAFIAIGVLVGMAGYLSYNEIMAVESAFAKVSKEDVPAVWALGEVKTNLVKIELEPLEYMLEPDEEHPEELQAAREKIVTVLPIYGTGGREEKASRMAAETEDLFVLGQEIFTLKDSGASEDLLKQKFSHLDDRLDVFAREVETEEQLIAGNVEKSFMTLENDIRLTLNLIVILPSIAAAIAVAVGISVSYSISRPISRLRDAANQIGRGNYEVETNVTRCKDEIGDLSIQFGKMKEQLEQKEKMQNEFISVASHELRTPIQPILGFADLAINQKIKAEDALKVIITEGKRLQRLANDILDVSRIEGGHINFAIEEIPLNGLIEEMVGAVRVNVKDGVSLSTSLGAEDDLMVYADRARLAQVITNILGNAIKFTKKGSVKVETGYGEGNMVEIKISDTGGGIPAELLPHLFGKFVTTNVRSESDQGSGLGLYISKAIVNAHKGEISAYNNGDGATFVISLPVLSKLQVAAT